MIDNTKTLIELLKIYEGCLNLNKKYRGEIFKQAGITVKEVKIAIKEIKEWLKVNRKVTLYLSNVFVNETSLKERLLENLNNFDVVDIEIEDYDK